VAYTTQQLTQIVSSKLFDDDRLTQAGGIGEVIDLVPLARGMSGRIWRLQIVGSQRSVVIGKELEIRRILSPTHLYSSAFTVEKISDRFILHGIGWGHGVGMCQIGAAMMGNLGFNYKEILNYYYPNSIISQ